MSRWKWVSLIIFMVMTIYDMAWAIGMALQARWLETATYAVLATAGGVLTYLHSPHGQRWLERRRGRTPPRPMLAPINTLPVVDSLAEDRARALLRSMLTPAQLAEADATGRFSVPSPSIPGRVYSIAYCRNAVIKVYHHCRLTMYLCVQPNTYLPPSDVALMHKLSIEANEDEYLRVANRWYSAPPFLYEVNRAE